MRDETKIIQFKIKLVCRTVVFQVKYTFHADYLQLGFDVY